MSTMVKPDNPVRVLRFEVPLDGKWYRHDHSGPVVHCRPMGTLQPQVEVFVMSTLDLIGTNPIQFYRLFETAEDLPSGVEHIGSIDIHLASLHLFRAIYHTRAAMVKAEFPDWPKVS